MHVWTDLSMCGSVGMWPYISYDQACCFWLIGAKVQSTACHSDWKILLYQHAKWSSLDCLNWLCSSESGEQQQQQQKNKTDATFFLLVGCSQICPK